MMSWLAWLWTTVLPIVIGLGGLAGGLRWLWLNRQIRHIKAKIDSTRAELAALEGLTTEDRAWLTSYAPMYAAPPVDSIWEWRVGDPQTREVVKVEMTTGPDGGGPTGAVLIRGPSGERWVSLAEFYENTTPAPLRGRQ